MLKGLIKKQIHNLYLNNLLRGIAFSLFGIFVPIYFLTLGYSLQTIFVYFLVFQILTFVFILLGYRIAKKIGYKPLMITSIPATIIFITLLQLFDTQNIPVYLIALFNGIQNAFFFLPLHGFFSRLSEDKKRGTQVSNFQVFGKLSGLFGPLIGALIAVTFGFNYLFSFAAIFMIMSMIPLLCIKNVKPTETIKFKRMISLSKNHKGFFLGVISQKLLYEVSGTIWTVFIFLLLKNTFSIGGIGSLITLGAILFMIIIGKHYDKKSKYTILRIGGVLFALFWIARAFIDSNLFLFVSSFVGGFLMLMIDLPFIAIFYDKSAAEKTPDEFIIFTEIPGHIGKILIWVLAIILVGKFEVLFILAAIASILFTFLKFGASKKK